MIGSNLVPLAANSKFEFAKRLLEHCNNDDQAHLTAPRTDSNQFQSLDIETNSFSLDWSKSEQLVYRVRST